MRYVGIFLVLAAFPFFLSLLRSSAGRKWAFFAVGALPILHGAINADAALINWATWPGHTKGLILTLLDPLALAICIRYARKRSLPPLASVWVLYIFSLLPGLFVGSLFQPSLFYFSQAIRIALLAYAVYLVVSTGHLRLMANGLAVAVILHALFALKGTLTGDSQAPGLLAHQNLTGLAVNLCVPLLLALGLQRGGSLYLLAAAAGGISALAGGSRATIVFYAVSVVITLIGSSAIRTTPRKTTIALLGSIGLLMAAPFGVEKVAERGGVFSVDLERVAFERSARMMIADYPWGVGLNHYVMVGNTQGYMSRAGVRWGRGARATNVHNTYLLLRSEGGLMALIGWLGILLLPLIAALKLAFDKRAPMREACLGIAAALAVTMVHSGYEWVMVTVVPQYLIAILVGTTAAALAMRRQFRPSKSVPSVVVLPDAKSSVAARADFPDVNRR